MDIALETTHLVTARIVLKCLVSLVSCDCQYLVVPALISHAGRYLNIFRFE